MPRRTTVPLVIPADRRAILEKLDEDRTNNDSNSLVPRTISKYRISGVQPVPFSFDELMKQASTVFEEAPYEEIKDIVFKLLGKGGDVALLRQSFDMNETGAIGSGRKEIVFGLIK